MQLTSQQIERVLDRVLNSVEKPGRYIGGEYNSVSKDWDSVAVRTVFAFPDLYDLGMSNLGWMILYSIINDQPDMFADRVFSPWVDMEDVMRREGIPLYGLESKHPITDFDLFAISIPYEQLYTNVLNMLDLAGMPVRSLDRDERYPLVMAGGHSCYNPEPMSDFIDVFVIGEGEDITLEVARLLGDMKGASRADQLRALSRLDGIYVPRFYDVRYHDDGTIESVQPNSPDVPEVVTKRIVPVLPDAFTRFLVPHVETVHNRAPIEIMRGCTRGCRFCHAGMVTRPVRERPVAEVVAAADEIVRNTGFEELSLLSLSSSDYTHVQELVQAINDHFDDYGISVSLPSLRIESVSVDLMDALGDARRGGFTFAPEAATERMRDIINKAIPDSQLLSTAHEAFARGWRTIKLYFMIGHPSETLEDVQAIVDLAKLVLEEGRKVHGNKASVNVGVSTFVPKPHTPFQWVPVDTMDQIRAKQSLLRRGLRGHGLNLRWNKPEETQLEAFLSRGDRRMGAVVERAWRLGTKFDGWQEHANHEAWRQAFVDCGLDMDFYIYRERPTDESFPWEHISIAVKKKFLVEDYQMSLEGETRHDCRDGCFACGILPQFIDMRRETPADAWKCPEVKPRSARRKAAQEVIPLTSVS